MNPLGIRALGTHIPHGRISNLAKMEAFEVDEQFIVEKLGVRQRAIKAPGDTSADLCARAFEDLEKKGAPDRASIECVVAVTQNPGATIPHLSARIHAALGLPESCACFDLSLGCSGYVYGLSVIQSFMAANGFQHGLLFTCDPYSPIIAETDKNTALLFGDAATVTWIGPDPTLIAGRFTFGTLGAEHAELTCPGTTGPLYMNGRAVFNFAARYVPRDLQSLLTASGKTLDDVDRFIFHQGSKYIVDTLAKLLRIPPGKVPFDIMDYGNTVSSSIPIILAKDIARPEFGTLLLCGFGAGLSWSSTLLSRPSNL